MCWELQQRYPKCPSAVPYWKFYEGSGNIAYDSVDNNNGTIYGADWTNGIDGTALHFESGLAYICGVDQPRQPKFGMVKSMKLQFLMEYYLILRLSN
jgi:hypothetical protein